MFLLPQKRQRPERRIIIKMVLINREFIMSLIKPQGVFFILMVLY